MWSRVKGLAERLTADEKSALEELGHGTLRERIPFSHAERLLALGLAELSLGRLDLTSAGRHALAELRGA